MIRQVLLSAAFALGVGSAGQAATIDLASSGLQLSGGPIASSTSMSISDTASIDLGFVLIPGFFQALDSGANPALELNPGDGLTFNLSVTPGFTAVSTETAREGDRQLEFLFDVGGIDQAFARLNLAVGPGYRRAPAMESRKHRDTSDAGSRRIHTVQNNQSRK